MLIRELFLDKSNYEIILNFRELTNHIKILLKPTVKVDKSKSKNKKSTKYKKGGGNRNDLKKVSKILENKNTSKKNGKEVIKKNNDKKIELITLYNFIFNYCYVEKDKNLNKIYVESFNSNMKEYFKNELENKIEADNRGELNIANISLINPFNKKSLKFVDLFINYKKTIIDKDDINDIIKTLVFPIYESNHLFLNIENEIEIDDFLSSIKYKIILVLYSLYSIKKKLYETYINSINNIFNIEANKSKQNTTNTETNTETNTKTKTNTKTNTKIKKNNENSNIETEKIKKNNKNSKINNENGKSNKNNFNIKIKNIKNKIDKLQNKNGIFEQDEKIMQYKDEIKKLIIKKYS